MLVVKKGTVKHNGKEYGTGEIISDITEAERDRLVRLDACQYIQDASNPQPSPSDDAKAPVAGVDSADLNLNVNPADTIKGAKN